MASVAYDYIFRWKNNEEREKLFGKRCRVITKGMGMRSIVIEFEDGKQVVTSERAIKRAE